MPIVNSPNKLAQQVEDGLITQAEADRILAERFTWLNELDPRVEFLKVLDDTLRETAERGEISDETRTKIFAEVHERSK